MTLLVAYSRLLSHAAQHSVSLKADLVARTLEPGASVSAIALEHGLNTNLLFAWRRKHLRELAQGGKGAAPAAPPVLLPVQIAGSDAQPHTAAKPHTANGTIEIDVGGACVRVRGAVDEDSLGYVVRLLREPRE